MASYLHYSFLSTHLFSSSCRWAPLTVGREGLGQAGSLPSTGVHGRKNGVSCISLGLCGAWIRAQLTRMVQVLVSRGRVDEPL